MVRNYFLCHIFYCSLKYIKKLVNKYISKYCEKLLTSMKSFSVIALVFEFISYSSWFIFFFRFFCLSNILSIFFINLLFCARIFLIDFFETIILKIINYFIF